MHLRSRIILVATFFLAQHGVAVCATSTLDERVISPAPAIPIDTSIERFGSLDIWGDFQRAGEFYQSGQWDSALYYYDRIVGANPNIADAYIGRGVCYLLYSDKPESAIADFRKSLEITPENALAYNNLGLAYLLSSQLDSARNNLDLALSINPQFHFAHFNFGMLYDTLGEYDSSLASYSEAISLGLETPEVYTMQGFAYHNSGKKSHALNSMRLAMQIDSTYWPALYYQGRIYFDGNAFVMAGIMFGQAIEYAPDEPLLYFYRGKAFIEQKEYEKAGAELDKLDNLLDTDCYSSYERGVIDLLQDDLAGSLIHYTRKIECDSLYTQAYFARGYSYVLLSDWNNAVIDYTRFLVIQPGNKRALNKRAECYMKLGDTTNAIDDFSSVIMIDSLDSDIFYTRGMLQYASRKYELARFDLDRAHSLNPRKYYALLYRALSNYYLGFYEEAAADFEIYKDNKRFDNDLAYYFRALALIEIKEFDLALVELEALDGWFDRMSSASLSSISERTDDIKYSLGDVLLNMGRACIGLEEYKKAEKHLKRAIKKDRKNPIPHFFLAECYERMGKNKSAKKSYEKVLDMTEGGTTPITSLAKERIELIKSASK